jgi:hypothetical protein
MKAGPILEEAWRVKDQLAREAGCDSERFIENLRSWCEAHPPTGPMFRTAAELHRYAAEEERRRAENSVPVIRETPPPMGARDHLT